ncbi:MAG: hypothetical protein ABSD42_03990 [Candidatus Bathyarchaeia archaeon]|jgi:hypothetical protein
MGHTERVKLINEIEKKRGSKVVSFITADREGNLPPFMIADDAIRPLFRQLNPMVNVDKIDLFIYTRGGATPTAFKIAKLFRAFGKSFGAIVPHRAHSAGTLICLGADEVIMSHMGELSPVDPRTNSPFNPENKAGIPQEISVEDVGAYLQLAEKRAGLISEASKLEVFRLMSENAKPLALGNVNRVYNEIRLLVEELLLMHMDGLKDATKIARIKHELTEVYSHFYTLDFAKAKEIGLKVSRADPELEKLILELWDDYMTDLKVDDPFDPDAILGSSNQPINVNVKHAIIESSASCECYVRGITIAKPNIQPIQLQLPGMPVPSILTPHPSTVPSVVKYNMGRWIDISNVSNCV